MNLIYEEKLINKNISDIINYYGNAKYKILSKAVPKILVTKDNIEYIYDDITNKILKELDKECKKKIQQILNEPRARYFTRGFASNEFQF